jgi:hypothetical protein
MSCYLGYKFQQVIRVGETWLRSYPEGSYKSVTAYEIHRNKTRLVHLNSVCRNDKFYVSRGLRPSPSHVTAGIFQCSTKWPSVVALLLRFVEDRSRHNSHAMPTLLSILWLEQKNTSYILRKCENLLHDFILPPPYKWDLRSPEILHSYDW